MPHASLGKCRRRRRGGGGGCGVGFVSDISWQFMVGQVDAVVVLLFAICAYNGSSRSSSRS